MKYLKGMSIVLVALSLVVFVRTEALAKKVVGNINSVNIEHCGIAPGSCKGSVEIAQADGKKINLQIDFGSRLFKKVKESDRYILASLMITQLRNGDKVKADVVERSKGLWIRALVVQLKD